MSWEVSLSWEIYLGKNCAMNHIFHCMMKFRATRETCFKSQPGRVLATGRHTSYLTPVSSSLLITSRAWEQHHLHGTEEVWGLNQEVCISLYIVWLQMLCKCPYANPAPLGTAFSKWTEWRKYLITSSTVWWRNTFLMVEFQASTYRRYFEVGKHSPKTNCLPQQLGHNEAFILL